MNESIDVLGVTIKEARERVSLSRKALTSTLNISQRHLMYIENNSQKPSYKLLFRMIRELSIPADLIFYPELMNDRKDLAQAVVLLHKCSKKELAVVITTLNALLNGKSTI